MTWFGIPDSQLCIHSHVILYYSMAQLVFFLKQKQKSSLVHNSQSCLIIPIPLCFFVTKSLLKVLSSHPEKLQKSLWTTEGLHREAEKSRQRNWGPSPVRALYAEYRPILCSYTFQKHEKYCQRNPVLPRIQSWDTFQQNRTLFVNLYFKLYQLYTSKTKLTRVGHFNCFGSWWSQQLKTRKRKHATAYSGADLGKCLQNDNSSKKNRDTKPMLAM